ncbi:MAG: acyl-CoA thioesterase [Acidobacteriota bacterium]
MKFSQQFTVSLDDVDEQGHVNNVTYLRWIQDIAVAHLRDAATEEMQANFGWVVVRHEIDYKKPGFENDKFTVSTWVGD